MCWPGPSRTGCKLWYPKGTCPNATVAAWMLPDDLVNQIGDFEDNLVGASEVILSGLQDEIMRDLHQGWPRSVDGIPGVRDAGKDLSMPGAAVVSGELRLWYGDSQRPALELSSIRIAGLDTEG